MNMDKWNSLTAEQQDALTRAMAETTTRQYELSQKYEDEAVGVMEAAGCKVTRPTAWRPPRRSCTSPSWPTRWPRS